MWVWLGIISALFLGFYDISKKYALRENAVLPVLWLSVVAGLAVMFPLWLLSRAAPEFAAGHGLFIAPLPLTGHGLVLVKSLIISIAWILAYFAIKHLPISIVAPIRASDPVWTLLGALVLYHERPEPQQWAGLLLIFSSYYAFALIGAREGIHFHRNRWVGFILVSTLLGTCSGLYDKFLIVRQGYAPLQMQFWFEFYLVVFLGPVVFFFWRPVRHRTTPFRWCWSIPLIGLLLVLADYVYFRAVAMPGALLGILSALRRCSVVVTFFAGAWFFGDVNRRRKAAALIGVLAGVLLILFA